MTCSWCAGAGSGAGYLLLRMLANHGAECCHRGQRFSPLTARQNPLGALEAPGAQVAPETHQSLQVGPGHQIW